jgi:hypothetical protein
MHGYAKLIAAHVLALLEEAFPITTVAPRLSELRCDGHIKPSGGRTRNGIGFTTHIRALWPEGTPYIDAPSIAAGEAR